MSLLQRILCFAVLLAFGPPLSAQPAPRLVEVAAKPGESWRSCPTRTLEDFPASVTSKTNGKLGQFGGLRERRTTATGFFRTELVNGRWWLVDPEGCLFINQGVSSVKTVPTAGARAALEKKFGRETNWAERTVAMLREHGFNGLGAWSDTNLLPAVSPPLVQARIWNFMSAYGKKRGGTFQQPGHTGYPDNCIFVFDPGFERFCDEHARPLAATKDDPWLLGHFSDNEMPLLRQALRSYLALPDQDPGHEAALDWLRQRHGGAASARDITPQDESDFLGVVAERYFRIVSCAIKKHDRNHLYLGARFYGADLSHPEVFKACGPYVDVVSVNYYRAWTPDSERLRMWARESGKPILITEWYAKGEDSGMANTSGAGWLVKTQRDRGFFYQHFTLALLESRVCVGWHWFKYVDNDPADTKVDPSNRDSNKGIVNNRYEPYTPLLDAMKQINERTYTLIEFFDRKSGQPTKP